MPPHKQFRMLMCLRIGAFSPKADSSQNLVAKTEKRKNKKRTHDSNSRERENSVLSLWSVPDISCLTLNNWLPRFVFDLKNFKNLLESPQVIQKQLRDSPEPIFGLESHFKKSMKFAIFGNFRLQQRTDAIWCKSEPLNGILQGPQNLEKLFFWPQKCEKLFWHPQRVLETSREQSQNLVLAQIYLIQNRWAQSAAEDMTLLHTWWNRPKATNEALPEFQTHISF